MVQAHKIRHNVRLSQNYWTVVEMFHERDVAVPTANRRQNNVAPEKSREESVLQASLLPQNDTGYQEQ